MAQPDVAEMLPRVGKHWGWILGFGVLTLVAGVLVIIWPAETVLVAAILFGAQLVVSGIFRFVGAFVAPVEHGWVRALLALLAVLSFIVGIYLLRHPFFSVLILAVVLGIFWIMHGFIDLFAAIGYRDLPNRGVTAVLGLLGIVAGVIVLANPGVSLVFLAWVLGIWLVVLGIADILQGVMGALRRARPGPSLRPGSAPTAQ